MLKLLKLQPHKHTAKKLPHHHTSYRGLWVVMACFGLSLMLVHKIATAENLNVTAKIPAPMPTSPAIIENPPDKFISDSSNITLSGSCPVINPPIIVTIFRSGEFIGSGGCSVDGRYFVSVNLIEGVNILVPTVQTITNDLGPIGPAVEIIYQIPQNIKALPTAKASKTNLYLTIENPFVTYKAKQLLDWSVTIKGGKQPYKLFVDWGDNLSGVYNFSDAGQKQISHTYQHSQVYLIRISVTDADNQQATISVAAVTLLGQSEPNILGGTQSIKLVNRLTTFNITFIIYWMMVAVITAFWLGTKYEHAILASKPKKKKNP